MLCILTLPFQIKVLIFETQWGNGLNNPYTSFYVSAFDVALLCAGLSFLFFEKKKTFGLSPLPLILFLSFAAFSTLISPYRDQIFNFLLVLKLLEGLLFYTLLEQVNAKEILSKCFITLMSVEALWTLCQFVFQQDFGFQIIGETALSTSTANLARFSLGTLNLIRGYGTFPHPNILGGFLAISIFLTLHSNFKKNEKKILIAVLLVGLLVSFSRSALLALLVTTLFTGIGATLFKKKSLYYTFIVGIFLLLGLFCLMRGSNFLNDPALLERVKGFSQAWQMIISYPLGVGFSHFTLFLDTVSKTALAPWEYQPVHNIFILTLAELGIPFSLCLLVGSLYPIFSIKKTSMLWGAILILTILGLFDHYLISQDQGRFLLLFTISMCIKREAEHQKTLADPV